jgi:hypothetical protein
MGDGTFGVNLNMSRQDVATMLGRAMVKYRGITLPDMTTTMGTLSVFADVDSIAGYAKPSVAFLVNAGIINGYSESSIKLFKPINNITRAEISKIMSLTLYYVPPIPTPTPEPT